MRTISIILTLLTVCTINAKAQNLVPNPSFEDTVFCYDKKYHAIEAGAVKYWTQPTDGTSDLFHPCGDAPITCTGNIPAAGVPANCLGFQFPRTGLAYAGFINREGYGEREYLSCSLIDTLIINTTYCVTFFASLSDRSNYTCTNVGALFTVDSIKRPALDTSLNIAPQILNGASNKLTDTMNWIPVSSSFSADSAYTYLVIGNTLTNASSDSIFLGNRGPYAFSYLFIDDVSVYAMPPKPILGADTGACIGDTIWLTYDSLPPDFIGVWSTGDTLDSLMVTASDTIILNLVCPGGCIVSDTIVVSFSNPLPLPLINDTVVCLNDSLWVYALDSQYTYNWSTTDTGDSAYLGIGSYWIETGTGNCLTRDSFLIDTVAYSQINLGPDLLLCFDETLILTNPGAANPLWSTGEITEQISVTDTGWYWLEAQSGACRSRDSIHIGLALASWTLDAIPDTILAKGSELMAILSEGNTSQSWYLNDELQTAIIDTLQFIVDEESMIRVQFIDSLGCLQEDSLHLQIIAICDESNLLIPDAFSPNGDGLADRFFIAGLEGGQINEIRIYDRWGAVVFHSENIATSDYDRSWDGTKNGKEVQDGMYLYSMQIQCSNAEAINVEGVIYLVR